MRRNCARALNGVNFDLWFQYQNEKFRVYQEKVVHGIYKSLDMLTEDKQFSIPKYTDWLKKHAPQEAEVWRYERGENASLEMKKVSFSEAHNARHTKEIEILEKHNSLDYPNIVEFHSVYEKNSSVLDECAMRSSGNPLHISYFKHLAKVLKDIYKEAIFDTSRVDAIVALRMRSTGHNQENIEKAIKECAIQWRNPNERKSWDDYARRTAEYAFSYCADREIIKQQDQLEEWHKCEFGNRQKGGRQRFSF